MYTQSSSNASACVLNCTLAVAGCLTCQLSNTGNTTVVQCLNCTVGMSLNNTNNSCNAVCGDGVLATIEQCDTAGVTANGCSATCTIEPSFFCTGTVGSASVCQSCIANCLNCTNAIDCQLCDSLYDFNISNSSCDPNCSIVADCVSCTVVSNAISCQSCVLGY